MRSARDLLNIFISFEEYSMKEVAPLRYGVIFKKAFGEPEVFKGFVRDFLGIHLEIDKVETEKSFPDPVGNVASRFDLFAEDKKNRIIVDIQHARHSDHYHRFLHYHCAALLEQAVKYSEYRPARTVFTLVVLTSGDKHKTDIAVVDFDPKTLDGRPLNEIAHKVVYICPKYIGEQTPAPYREWMRAIEDSLDGTVDETSYSLAEVLKVFDLIERDTLSPEERARIIDERREEKYGDDKFIEGVEKGIKEGIEKGIKEGMEKGIRQKADETARVMLKKEMDIRLVSELTGLSETEILNMKENPPDFDQKDDNDGQSELDPDHDWLHPTQDE
ncbi:conserved hypothetical protein [Gammaproteobacteria bacterium]